MKLIRASWEFFKKITGSLRSFLGELVEPAKEVTDPIKRGKARLSASMALVIFAFNLIGIVFSLSVTEPTTIYSLFGFCAVLISAYFLSRTRFYKIGGSLLVVALSALAYLPIFIRSNLTPSEISNSIYSFLPISLVIASGILGLPEMFIGAIVNMLIISSVPALFPAYSFAQAGTDAGNIVTIGFLLLIVVAYRNAAEKERLAQIEEYNAELQAANKKVGQIRDTLEIRVQERTTELEHRSRELAQQSAELSQKSAELAKLNTHNAQRAAQFQAIASVSHAIASVKNLEKLLPQITEAISNQFGFYHIGIFLADEAHEFAVLSASNSAGGQRMLNRGHRLKIGQVGIVGNVVGSGAPRIALDTGKDAVFFENPDLPETRSEMALPLLAGKEIIGALDVQSTQSNAFLPEDIEVLATLADQVSIAIQNARQFETTQKSLAESEAIYRQYIRKEWSGESGGQKISGYKYNLTGTTPIEGYSEQTAASDQIRVEKDANASTIAIPIKLRGEIIGILDVQASEERNWKQDEIDIVQAVADRVAISAENARLFDETTSRAERERAVSEITSKIRSTNDPNEMIQIALSELKQALQVKNAKIGPYIPPQSQDQS
jgi:GAF domain-containing protein